MLKIFCYNRKHNFKIKEFAMILLKALKKLRKSVERLGISLLKKEQRLEYKMLKKMLDRLSPQSLSENEKDSSITSSNIASLYPSFCLAAANNDEIFKGFRLNPIYTQVLEHCTYEYGLEYLKLSKDTFKSAEFEEFKRNDLFGIDVNAIVGGGELSAR